MIYIRSHETETDYSVTLWMPENTVPRKRSGSVRDQTNECNNSDGLALLLHLVFFSSCSGLLNSIMYYK